MKTRQLGIIIYLICIVCIYLVGYGLFNLAHAEGFKEISMKTTVGEVVLTTSPCTVVNEQGFEFSAYATEGEVIHNGCWFKDHDIVNILFYEEDPHLVASYRDYYFLPR